MAASKVVTPARRSSLMRRSWRVRLSRSLRPRPCGELGGDVLNAQALEGPAHLGELLGADAPAGRGGMKSPASAVGVERDGKPGGLKTSRRAVRTASVVSAGQSWA